MRLGLASVNTYPEFVAELSEITGMDTGYLRCGSLLAARDRDEAEALGRELALRERLGLAAHRLRASEARRVEPALAPTLRLALDVPDDHAIDPRKLTAALVAAFKGAGGELRTESPVAELACSGERVNGIRLADTGEQISAEHVVMAAGVWSEEVDGLSDEDRVPI